MSGKTHITTEDFIRRAREIHGDKFDYSLVEYVKAETKVKIICPIHGVFEQTPSKHLYMGHGCPKCGREESRRLTSLTKETFLERAYAKFGDKFTYHFDLDITFSAQYPIRITCPIHGDFILKAGNFLKNKWWCGACGETSPKTKRIGLTQFIEKSKLVHGDKYDYSKVNYIDANTKVTIICPTHGEFLSIPIYHYGASKKGCAKCTGKIRKDKQLESFLQEVPKVHNYKYDYSLVTEWDTCGTKVNIICPIHGVFEQAPYQHLNMGQGCPKCANEKSKVIPTERYKNIKTLFYSFKYKGVYKIGITTKTLQERYVSEGDFSKFTEIQEYTFPCYLEAFTFEQLLIDKYREFKYYGKRLFKNTGTSECFKVDILSMFLEEGGTIGN